MEESSGLSGLFGRIALSVLLLVVLLPIVVQLALCAVMTAPFPSFFGSMALLAGLGIAIVLFGWCAAWRNLQRTGFFLFAIAFIGALAGVAVFLLGNLYTA